MTVGSQEKTLPAAFTACTFVSSTLQAGSLSRPNVLAPMRKTSFGYTQNVLWLCSKFKRIENHSIASI
jgi:hypothetical protein